jgi:hypothetical protein
LQAGERRSISFLSPEHWIQILGTNNEARSSLRIAAEICGKKNNDVNLGARQDVTCRRSTCPEYAS